MPPRIVYLFSSIHNAGVDAPWSIRSQSKNDLALFLMTEGWHLLWQKLIERGAISGCLCVVESNRSPGRLDYGSNHYCIIMPHIDHLDALIEEGDIILARGGFRPWPPFLKRMNDQRRWVWFYRAATNRGPWPFWDVVLDDLIPKSVQGRGRLYYAFNKPIRPDLFYYREVPKVYDVIINASHIHDRKGQWKAINALIAYRNKYGKSLKAVMPGGFYRGFETRQIQEKVRKHGLDVEIPGMVPRDRLSEYYSQSKLYIHLGAAGQNDRGPLEAMACGCPIILGNPKFHAPFLYADKRFCTVVRNQLNPYSVAEEIQQALSRWSVEGSVAASNYFEGHNSLENAVIGQFEKLIKFCSENPVDRKALINEFTK